jgi:hypothetical protein
LPESLVRYALRVWHAEEDRCMRRFRQGLAAVSLARLCAADGVRLGLLRALTGWRVSGGFRPEGDVQTFEKRTFNS